MLVVHNIPLDFDITCPEDLFRYNNALLNLQKQKKPYKSSVSTSKNNNITEYAEFLKQECKTVTDFIDNVFGGGTCNKLLGDKASLTNLMDLCDEITLAIKDQTKNAQKRFSRYEPNRKTINVNAKKIKKP